MTVVLAATTSVWLASAPAAADDPASNGARGVVTPRRAFPGDVVLVKAAVRADEAVNPRVEVSRDLLPAWPTQYGHEVLVPVPKGSAPGLLPLRLVGTRARAATEEELNGPPLLVEVQERPSQVVRLQVDPQFVDPSPEERARIEQDAAAFGQAFDSSAEALEVRRQFRWPRPVAKVVGRFAELRLWNGEKQTEHEGVDLEAREGEVVLAANDGTVVLNRDCFHAGQTIVIDHGGRVFTSYSHLSAAQVKAGQRVRQGDQIGLAGRTGRSAGPRLHFGVHISGAYVDPESFMRLRLDRPVSEGHARSHDPSTIRAQ